MQKRLTQRQLKAILSYDPVTGIFTWLSGPRKGRKAGCPDNKGYTNIMIKEVNYKAHRLAWVYVYGTQPKARLDHINLDKTDDRIENLREATDGQNQWNRGLNKNNTSGFKGVTWDRQKRKWTASITLAWRHKHLGRFADKVSAARAYDEAAAKHFGAFAWLNFPQMMEGTDGRAAAAAD